MGTPCTARSLHRSDVTGVRGIVKPRSHEHTVYDRLCLSKDFVCCSYGVLSGQSKSQGNCMCLYDKFSLVCTKKKKKRREKEEEKRKRRRKEEEEKRKRRRKQETKKKLNQEKKKRRRTRRKEQGEKKTMKMFRAYSN